MPGPLSFIVTLIKVPSGSVGNPSGSPGVHSVIMVIRASQVFAGINRINSIEQYI
jgi:hypothetical protein